jgi:type II secretory pathway pseudopilin PulG
MVVLAIMVVVLGIGIPSLSAIFDLEQRSAARTLANTYSFLLTEASMRNVTFRIAYNLDARSYTIEVGDPDTLVFSDPATREAFEEEQQKAMKRFSPSGSLKDGEEAPTDPTQRFANLTMPGFESKVELPTNCVFAWVYTPQYTEPQTPSDPPPENAEDQRIVYSYIFANGESEHTVVRIVDADDPEDGYTVEVEPLSGKVTVESELTDIGESMAWLPGEAPTIR